MSDSHKELSELACFVQGVNEILEMTPEELNQAQEVFDRVRERQQEMVISTPIALLLFFGLQLLGICVLLGL